jgi:hypothetical protein
MICKIESIHYFTQCNSVKNPWLKYRRFEPYTFSLVPYAFRHSIPAASIQK